MLDTLEFITKDFGLDLEVNALSKYPLVLKYVSLSPLCTNMEQPFLIKDINGHKVYGHSLVLQEPFKNTGILSIGAWETNHVVETWLRFRCSLPNYLYGVNFYTGNHGDLMRFKKELEKDFKEIGIYVNASAMRLSRLDLTKNVELNYPVPYYLQTLKQCANNIKNAVVFSKEVNTQTFTANKTKHNQVCAYNKLDCMENNQETIPIEIRNKNVLRVENRFLKKETVKAHTGFVRMNDLLDGYELVNGIYRKEVEKILFNGQKK